MAKIYRNLILISAVLIAIGFAVHYKVTTADAAMPRGVWMCFASTEKTLEPDYDCEAKAYHKEKDVAAEIAKYKCEDKCYAECKVEACIRKR